MLKYIFPEQASTFATRVDPMYYFLVIFSAVVCIGIGGLIIYFAVRYRKIEGENRPSKALHSIALELTWTVIPGIGGIAIFAWGALLYNDFANAPEGALEIDVVGKQWMWKVQHANGMREVNDLHVPVGRPVKITMTSQDVLHDYYIPAFRVKHDVVPGRFTSMWFEATKTGEYHLFCAEYCGTEHSLMGGTVYVMEPEDYAQWLEGGPKTSPQESGQFLFEQRGCVTCHSGASGARGPNLMGVYGSTVTLGSGDEVIADEEYLRESIMQPALRVVDGFSPLMPSFSNQLTEEDVMDLVAYIKSLSAEEGAE